MSILVPCMIYSGSVLMVYNILHYYQFAKRMKKTGVLELRRSFLNIPLLLLIFFLIGYIITALVGSSDLVTAGILLGGSIFVFMILSVMIRIVGYIQEDESRVSAMYNDLRDELSSITKDRLAVFRVNLTKDLIEDRAGTDLYESDKRAATYTELMLSRFPDLLIRPAEEYGPGLFTREGLLEQFRSGRSTASETVYARRKSIKTGFFLMEATLARQPVTGDVIAFVTERDYNKDIIDKTIWNKALSEEYDAIAYIASGQLGVVLSGGAEGDPCAVVPAEDETDYQGYAQRLATVLTAEEGEQGGLSDALSLERVERELSGRDVYTVDALIPAGEGAVHKRFTFFAADREAGFYALLISDTTSIRKAQEEQNRLLEEALERANASSAAKTAFLSNMSHDIRTPMNAIIGFTGLAMRTVDDPRQTGDYLRKIQVSSDHLLSLINDVLEMSRIESGKIELENGPCSIPELLWELRTMINGQAEAKGQELLFDAEQLRNGSVVCDRLRLNQVLLNLLSNAIKYTPEGGRIEVTARQTGAPAGAPALYEFRVKDNGIGMSPEFAAKIFEAFEREKTTTVSGIQGTGLGMAITKRIVDLMGGSIDLITAPGRGSEFVVSVPFEVLPEQDGTHPETEKAERRPASFDGKRLLLVDDMEINREIAVALLEMNGFTVEQAENGKAAVEMVASSEPGYYDAVLMDVQMPVMNGYEATKQIRSLKSKRLASVPIIAMTANAFEEDRRAAISAGMNGHIAKPIDPDTLMSVLADTLDTL